MCKSRWDTGVQLQFTQGLDCTHSKCQGSKRKTPKTVPFRDTINLLQRLSCPPPPLHLQSMVETALLSGYKSQRTKGHKGGTGERTGEVGKGKNRGEKLKAMNGRGKKNWGKAGELDWRGDEKPGRKTGAKLRAEPRGQGIARTKTERGITWGRKQRTKPSFSPRFKHNTE